MYQASAARERDELANRIFELTLTEGLTDKPTAESTPSLPPLIPPPPLQTAPSEPQPASFIPQPATPPPLNSLAGLWILDYNILQRFQTSSRVKDEGNKAPQGSRVAMAACATLRDEFTWLQKTHVELEELSVHDQSSKALRRAMLERLASNMIEVQGWIEEVEGPAALPNEIAVYATGQSIIFRAK